MQIVVTVELVSTIPIEIIAKYIVPNNANSIFKEIADTYLD